MTDADLTLSVSLALARLPDAQGGLAILLATDATPPALAVLSSGDVLLEDEVIRVGIHASSSAVQRLDGGFSLLIPLDEIAVRLEAIHATTSVGRSLAMIKGRVHALRPTAEPPWRLEMRFRANPPDDDRIEVYVDYWRRVRLWLSGISPEPDLPF